MHIFFSGIGGTGIGPLALIAHQAGFEVSGSDAKNSAYVEYLRAHGIENIHIGQDTDQIARVHTQSPIDWYVYSAAVIIEQPDAPELLFCREKNIKTSMRDELLNVILEQKKLKLLAIAGTHGKTTTTAMLVWLMKELDIPVSYSVGAKMSFGEMGQYQEGSEYFVYEADEYARNFLAFHPHLSLITGIDWDHPDIYPTRSGYEDAFRTFLTQSNESIIWQADKQSLNLADAPSQHLISAADNQIEQISLPGLVNRQDAWQVVKAGEVLFNKPLQELIAIINRFPGVSRRFEKIQDKLYTDYAHTPPKIRGALQMAHEIGGHNVVVIYEGLHNTRQHFIKDELKDLFNSAKHLVIVPSYLAREDPTLAILTPEDLKGLLSSSTQEKAETAQLNSDLKTTIDTHIASGDLVLCLTAGGAGSLDEWLRKEFS